MEITLDLKKLKESGLRISEFLILSFIYQTKYNTIRDIHKHLYHGHRDALVPHLVNKLKDGLYIAYIDEVIVFRDKADKLFMSDIPEATFDKFWDEYHNLSGKRKTNKFEAERHWRRLTKKEKQLAMANIENYFNTVNDPMYIVKARTYLSSKLFADEYEQQPTDDFIERA